MNKTLLKLAVSASLAACMTVTVNAAPGADKVRITQVPADVQGCQAVGNVEGLKTGVTPVMLGNVVVGLGGDTLLLTVPSAYLGVAYRCARG
jgi:hypothetical protein